MVSGRSRSSTCCGRENSDAFSPAWRDGQPRYGFGLGPGRGCPSLFKYNNNNHIVASTYIVRNLVMKGCRIVYCSKREHCCMPRFLGELLSLTQRESTVTTCFNARSRGFQFWHNYLSPRRSRTTYCKMSYFWQLPENR